MKIIANGKADVSILVPTAGRPEAFALCEAYIARQDFDGTAQVIVADDGIEPAYCTIGQLHIRRARRRDDPEHTLGVNLLAGIQHVTADRLLLWEDDDAYRADHIRTVMGWLDEADLVGEERSVYYSLALPGYRRMTNRGRSSLFQTGMTRAVYDALRRACKRDKYVDLSLWVIWRGSKLTPFLEQPRSIGIKGMPGLPGSTAGWRKLKDGRWYTPDPDLQMLHNLIGDDVDAYRPYISYAEEYVAQ